MAVFSNGSKCDPIYEDQGRTSEPHTPRIRADLDDRNHILHQPKGRQKWFRSSVLRTGRSGKENDLASQWVMKTRD